MGTQFAFQKGGTAPPIFGAFLLWRTAGWIKMPQGSEVGLGPRHIVLDEELPPRKGTVVPHFSAHVYRSQTTGWIKMPLVRR